MPYALRVIADTSDRFTDFTPYVPAIDGHGRVAFRAALRAGGSAILLGGEGPVVELARSGDLVRDFTSHPDLADDGSFCAFAVLRSGAQALVHGRDGSLRAVVDSLGPLVRIGPLGPTMNEAGAIAFRADAASGGPGIFKADAGTLVPIAGAGRFKEFHGLPVIDGRGRVVFRADAASGEQGIHAGGTAALETLVDTRSAFAALGRFPCVDDAGMVAFAATRRDGGAGVFRVSDGVVTVAMDGGAVFESVRGALLDGRGGVVSLATPRGGTLGVYDGAAQRIVGLGDRSFGSNVVDLALNPVSINRGGQLAIRLTLASGRQVVARADPAPS